jgi:3-phosphoshikimate 1-carboxyvinyltransferase
MKIIVQKTNQLSGSATPPASKSQTIRGLLFGLLAKGTSEVISPLKSDDTRAALSVCQALGAKISAGRQSILIKSSGVPIVSRVGKIFTGNSGITTRFILPILGLRENCHQPIILDCGRQMKTRPIGSLIDALNQLGMKIKSEKNSRHCPLSISGRLTGGKARISGITSQYLSALLMALPCAEKNSEITVIDLCEKPYVEMTEKWLKEQGIIYSYAKAHGKDIYKVQGRQVYSAFSKKIPGDFSSASYVLAAGVLLGRKLTLMNLDFSDVQGDKQLVSILKKMGADIRTEKSRLIIKGGRPLRGIKIDASAIPDLAPTLAVIGTQAKGKTEILNVPQARLKETDRLRSMAEGLRRMGAKIYEKPDGMVVYQSRLKGNKVQGFHDHRTVMALSLAGLLAEGQTVITTAQAVNKTYPDFVKTMKSLGAKISLIK